MFLKVDIKIFFGKLLDWLLWVGKGRKGELHDNDNDSDDNNSVQSVDGDDADEKIYIY